MDAKSSKSSAGSFTKKSVAATPELKTDVAKQRRRSLVTVPLFVGALLPFGFSMYFHTHPPAAQPVEKGAERSPLVFGQYMVNLGPVNPGHKHEQAWFAFMNKGSQPITLLPPIPSCQCLRTQYRGDKRVYEPGEKGWLDVFLETAKESEGEKEFLISVPYQAGSRTGEEELTFRVTLPKPQVALNKPALMFYQLNRDEQAQEIKIIDTRSKPLSVLSMEPSSELDRPLSEATLGPVVNEDGKREFVISVRVPGDIPERSIRESILVKTDDPEYKTIRIPIWIDGRKITLSHPTDETGTPPSDGSKKSD